jgi:hypothetical protein
VTLGVAVLAAGFASSLALAQPGGPHAAGRSTATLTICRKQDGRWHLMRIGSKLVRRSDAPAIGGRCPVANRVILCTANLSSWRPIAVPPALVRSRIANGDRRPSVGRCPPTSLTPVETPTSTATTTTTVATTTTAGTTTTAAPTTPPAPVSFPVDIQPLAVTIAQPPDLRFATGSTSVTVAITGGVGPYVVQLVVDGAASGGSASSATLSWPTTDFADGLHALAVTVSDATGTRVISPTIHQTVDNTPPTVQALAPPDGDRDNGPTVLQVNASDTFGVASVQFTVDGVDVGPLLVAPDIGTSNDYSATFDTSTLVAGTHVVSAVVTDNAGNTALGSNRAITTGPFSYLPVLNYHGIEASPSSIYALTPADAAAQLTYLHENGYQSVTLEQYQHWLAGQDIGVAKPVLITIDDGLANQVPWDDLLRQYGFSAVMFVVTGFADNTTPGVTGPENLTWSQLQALAIDGRWEIALHAGTYGHGDRYASGLAANGFTYATACPYFYTCLGTGESVSRYEADVAAEVDASIAELKAKIPSASSLAWSAPFNDAGQWTTLYNDPSHEIESWMPSFFASRFPLVFTETSPITYGQAPGLVGSLTDFNRHYRFEVHSDTTIAQFAAQLADPAFAR